MTPVRPIKPVTHPDVLDAPEQHVAELLNGETHPSPRPGSRQLRAMTRLGGALRPFDDPGADEPGGWVTLHEPELRLGAQVLVPDLAGWLRERMPEVPDDAYLTLAPDWVCEVTSASTQKRDRLLKMPIYREAGVEWLWLVEPLTEVVEVFRRVGRGWVLAAQAVGAGPVRLPPFELVELDPSDWFSR